MPESPETATALPASAARWPQRIRLIERISVGAILLVITLLGLQQRLVGLDAVGLWFDEWITVEETTRPTVLDTITAEGSHPPMLRLMMRASIAMFGDMSVPGGADRAARYPVVLLGTLCIPVLVLFARRFSGGNSLVGLVAAAFWAFGAYGIYYGQEARYYSGLVLFSAWALHGLAWLRETPRDWKRHVWLGLGLYLGPMNQALFGLLFILLFVCIVPTMLRNIRRNWVLPLPWIAAGLLYLPWFIFSMKHLEDQGRPWLDNVARASIDIPVAFFTGRIGAFHLMHNDMPGYLATLSWAAFMLLAAGFLIHCARRSRGLAWISAFIVLTSLIGTAAIHDQYMSLRFFHHKYLAFIYPFVCLAIGELVVFLLDTGADVPWWRQLLKPAPAPQGDERRQPDPLLVASIVCRFMAWAIALVIVWGHVGPVWGATQEALARMKPGSPYLFHKEPYREAAAWAQQWRTPGTPVIVFAEHGINDGVLRYYGITDPLLPVRREHRADASGFWNDVPMPGLVDAGEPAMAPRAIVIDGHCDDAARELALRIGMDRYPRLIAQRWFGGCEGWMRVSILERR
ncbi:MAG: hypothetical protein AB7S36_02480 [Planctomycetota bacterium]